MTDSLRALFRPDRIAVIGASAKPEKMGFQILKNILDAGFEGQVIPVNPKGETILGVPSVKSVDEIPPGIDLCVVIIPAPSVPGTVLQLGQKKVKAAIIITGGFAESGAEGARLQEEVAENASRCGIRVVGPNCQGVNYPHHRLCASWPLITRRGAMAIASQSGTVGAALADWAAEERLGFSAFVSMGNRIDVDEADLIEFFASDPNTKVITLYIEGVKNARRFLTAVQKCRKPIVIFKAGRTERGRKAAESHTRSLAGKDEVYDAVFRQFGVHRATTLEELYDFQGPGLCPGPCRAADAHRHELGWIRDHRHGRRGGERVPRRSPACLLASQLREILPPHCIVGNPLDLTGDTDAERYRRVLDSSRGHYDVVMTIFGDPIPGASGDPRPRRARARDVPGRRRRRTLRAASPSREGDRRLSDAGTRRQGISLPCPLRRDPVSSGVMDSLPRQRPPLSPPESPSLRPTRSLSWRDEGIPVVAVAAGGDRGRGRRGRPRRSAIPSP